MDFFSFPPLRQRVETLDGRYLPSSSAAAAAVAAGFIINIFPRMAVIAIYYTYIYIYAREYIVDRLIDIIQFYDEAVFD